MNVNIPRLEASLKSICKEDVKVEIIGGVVYAFGSELATLRLFAKYNANGSSLNQKVRVGYSVNRKSYYFSLEI